METVAEKRKREMINKFLERFGRIPTPKCWECKKEVERFIIDAEVMTDTLISRCECHGDKTEFRIPYLKAMGFNNLVISWAFAPKQGHRVDGKIKADMLPTNTRKYSGNEVEPVTEEEKRDILEIPKDKPLGGYAS